MTDSTPNRRSSKRVQVHLPASWSCRDDAGMRVSDEGEVRDVSVDGLFLEPFCLTTHPLFPGTKIHVSFRSPMRDGTIDAHGTVRWTGIHRAHRVGGVGIELDEFDTELDRFIKQKA